MTNGHYNLLTHYTIQALLIRCDDLEAALERIAAPQRPDGSWNLSREACREIAREALGRTT